MIGGPRFSRKHRFHIGQPELSLMVLTFSLGLSLFNDECCQLHRLLSRERLNNQCKS
jgi:hypothetical protein